MVDRGARLDVRPSPIAGSWYPADPRRLAASVDGYLDAAHLPPLAGAVVGVVAPHAGHRYSGAVAGHAFRAVRGLGAELVALVGPMHDVARASVLATAHGAYATPLGLVPVDRDALDALGRELRELGGPDLALVANDEEHSLEIEVPFLQRGLGGPFRLLPVMVREREPDALRRLARALARTLKGRPALLVASTDLSHYHPESEAARLDGEMLRRLAAFDADAVLRAEEEGVGFACGLGALAAVLWTARDLGADRVRVLHYATSGTVTGDHAQVVGYGAAAIMREETAATPGPGAPA
jgi:MEMO1 family protein